MKRMKSIKSISMKARIVIASFLLVTIGFVLVIALTVKTTESKIADSMMEQFIQQDKQIAAQAELLISNKASVKQLQVFKIQ